MQTGEDKREFNAYALTVGVAMIKDKHMPSAARGLLPEAATAAT